MKWMIVDVTLSIKFNWTGKRAYNLKGNLPCNQTKKLPFRHKIMNKTNKKL